MYNCLHRRNWTCMEVGEGRGLQVWSGNNRGVTNVFWVIDSLQTAQDVHVAIWGLYWPCASASTKGDTLNLPPALKAALTWTPPAMAPLKYSNVPAFLQSSTAHKIMQEMQQSIMRHVCLCSPKWRNSGNTTGIATRMLWDALLRL